MADGEPNTQAVESIKAIPGAVLSEPLRDAIKTIVEETQTLARADKHVFDRHVATKGNEAGNIADLLQYTIKGISKAREGTAGGETFVRDVANNRAPGLTSYGDLGIVETVGHLAYDNSRSGTMTDRVKNALETLAQAGGMSREEAGKTIARLETGEKEIQRSGDGSVHRTDQKLLEQGRTDVNEAMGPLQSAIDRGLKIDIATHAAGDPTAIANLPAKKLNQNQSIQRE
jgi:hypothetical protein